MAFYLALLGDPERAVRGALAHIAWRYKLPEVMNPLSERETDPSLKAAIDGILGWAEWDIQPDEPEPPADEEPTEGA